MFRWIRRQPPPGQVALVRALLQNALPRRGRDRRRQGAPERRAREAGAAPCASAIGSGFPTGHRRRIRSAAGCRERRGPAAEAAAQYRGDGREPRAGARSGRNSSGSRTKPPAPGGAPRQARAAAADAIAARTRLRLAQWPIGRLRSASSRSQLDARPPAAARSNRRRSRRRVARPAVGRPRRCGFGPKRLASWLKPGLWPQIEHVRGVPAASGQRAAKSSRASPGTDRGAHCSLPGVDRRRSGDDRGGAPCAFGGARQDQIRDPAGGDEPLRHFLGLADPARVSARSKSASHDRRLGALPWRSSVSRRAYPQVSRFDLGFEHPHRLIRGRRERLAGAQAEARAMARADDFVAFDRSTREFRAVVRADVLDREIRPRCGRRRSGGSPPRP